MNDDDFFDDEGEDEFCAYCEIGCCDAELSNGDWICIECLTKRYETLVGAMAFVESMEQTPKPQTDAILAEIVELLTDPNVGPLTPGIKHVMVDVDREAFLRERGIL